MSSGSKAPRPGVDETRSRAVSDPANGFGKGDAIDQVRKQTPEQLERAVDRLADKLEERAQSRQLGLEAAFAMLHSSVEKQIVILSETSRNLNEKGLGISEKSIETAAAKGAESSIGKLANELKAKLEAISLRVAGNQTHGGTSEPDAAIGQIEPARSSPVANGQLDQQITAIQGLVAVMETQAIELAQVATQNPELLSEMPDAAEALVAAENALAAWTRQLGNVSTAVAIAKDASLGQKRAA